MDELIGVPGWNERARRGGREEDVEEKVFGRIRDFVYREEEEEEEEMVDGKVWISMFSFGSRTGM